MVETPTLTASASSSAISASDSPDSCWRLSAQNQTLTGAPRIALAERQREFQNIGRISAAPSISAASTAKPEIRESPNQSKPAGGGERGERHRALVGQPAPLRLLPRIGLGGGEQRQPQRLGQAGGGGRQRASILMAMPAIHHCGLSVSCPGICAP